MKRLFTKYGIIVLSLAVLIAVILSVMAFFSTTSAALPNIAGVIASPFRAAGAAISETVGGWFQYFSDFDALKEENEQLKLELAEMEAAIRQAEYDREENARLRELLGLREQRRDLVFESALIVEEDYSNWSSIVTVNKGTAHGVSVGDCAVTEAGYVVGVVTEAGLNWSTIRTLLGLISPTAGSARVLGLDCVRERAAILAQVGYMPSEAMFYPTMRVEEVICFSARLRRQDCRREAAELCRALELDGRRRIRELSLGNRKKVSIVCAMQHQPRLYILDEPTSGLDPLAQRTFWALLEERRKTGATVFLSSHVLSEVQRHCDRAAIIREGRLLREGTVEELAGAGARRVTLRGGDIPAALPGTADIRREPNGVSFLYSGPMDPLLEALRGRHLEDLHITEPDLEEIFLHYYEGGALS